MINFEDGMLVKGPYVVIDGKEYPVIMPEYTGNTPLSANNLNRIHDIIVSPTEPDKYDREKVWIRKGKNHLDLAQALSEAGISGKIIQNGVTISKSLLGDKLIFEGTCTEGFSIVLLNNLSIDLFDKYTFSFKVNEGSMTGGSVRMSINNAVSSGPTSEEARLLSVVWATGTTGGKDTQEVLDEAQYLSMYINAGCVFTGCVLSLQLEQGPIVTEHEPYVSPAIYIKNNNDVYEEYTKKNNNFAVLTGDIITPEANSGSMNGITTLAYPIGFNKDNCMVISIMSRNTRLVEPTYNTVGSTGYSLEEAIGNYGLQANLSVDGIKVTVYKVNDAAETKKINIKVVLMKIY